MAAAVVLRQQVHVDLLVNGIAWQTNDHHLLPSINGVEYFKSEWFIHDLIYASLIHMFIQQWIYDRSIVFDIWNRIKKWFQ